jgi:hypothetical protein
MRHHLEIFQLSCLGTCVDSSIDDLRLLTGFGSMMSRITSNSIFVDCLTMNN